MGIKGRKGQAIVEMAVFGALILFLFGTLLSYLQQANDQQYASMETFRRALERACTYQGAVDEGAGASVRYTVLQRRHNTDVSGNYKKGAPGMASGASNVFWAVTKSEKGVKPDTLLVFRVNEDQKEYNYRTFVGDEYDRTDDEGVARQRYRTFEIVNIDTKTDTQFSEQTKKKENDTEIINTKVSQLKDVFTPSIIYSVVERDKDDKDYRAYPTGEKEIPLWAPEQYVYRDSAGQYKYSENVTAEVKDEGVIRGREWTTKF